MKVLILAFGTRGDVQPFVALARELRERGHEPVLAAPRRFTDLAATHDQPLTVVDDGPLRLMDRSEGVGDAMTGVRGKVRLARAMPATFRQLFDDCTAIATSGQGRDADVIVHNGQIIAAPHLAELLDVPAVLALTVPVYVPTREFPWPGQALPAALPGLLNRATYLGMKAPSMMFGPMVDRWRREVLGLPRRRGRHDPLRAPKGRPAPVLNAVSAHVVPPPADWPDSVATTGYWFLPAATRQLPDDLRSFLEAGEPPVCIGFGSMSGPDPAATTATVLAAIAQAGVRAVVATGWGGLHLTDHDAAQVRGRVLAIAEAPYDLLLPHVAAAVHHGGAGTTAAAAAAGTPPVICPFVADQPFWGTRMHALGVATEPIPQRRLTAERLAAALRRAAADSSLRTTAQQLSARIRREAGVATAVDRLEIVVASSAPRTGR